MKRYKRLTEEKISVMKIKDYDTESDWDDKKTFKVDLKDIEYDDSINSFWYKNKRIVINKKEREKIKNKLMM